MNVGKRVTPKEPPELQSPRHPITTLHHKPHPYYSTSKQAIQTATPQTPVHCTLLLATWRVWRCFNYQDKLYFTVDMNSQAWKWNLQLYTLFQREHEELCFSLGFTCGVARGVAIWYRIWKKGLPHVFCTVCVFVWFVAAPHKDRTKNGATWQLWANLRSGPGVGSLGMQTGVFRWFLTPSGCWDQNSSSLKNGRVSTGEKLKNNTCSHWNEWGDCVFFCQYDTLIYCSPAE